MEKLSFKKIYSIITIFLIIIAIFISLNITIKSEEEEEEEESTPLLGIILLFIGIFLIVTTFQITKRISNLFKRPFIYFTISIFFFSIMRIFYYLNETLGLEVSGIMITLWWHLIFYISMGIFLMGLILMETSTLSLSQKSSILNIKDKIIFGVITIISIILFITFFSLPEQVNSLIERTLLDHRNGFIHFLAFIIGGLVVAALIDTKKKFGKTITSSFIPFLLAISFISLVHVWELLTESYHIINIAGSIIEPVEDVLTIISMSSFLIAYLKIKKNLRI